MAPGSRAGRSPSSAWLRASLVERLREQHPGVDIHCAEAIGEDAAVIEALAAYCLRSLPA